MHWISVDETDETTDRLVIDLIVTGMLIKSIE